MKFETDDLWGEMDDSSSFLYLSFYDSFLTTMQMLPSGYSPQHVDIAAARIWAYQSN